MKLGLLTSNHIRHKFLANELNKKHELSIIISEEKGNQDQLVGRNDEENIILKKHFESLKIEQEIFFGKQQWPKQVDVIRIDRGSINSTEVEIKLKENKINGLAVFGPGILKENIFSISPGNVINAHQGISPYYRGSATNFWPFVNGELSYVGVTMHYIDKGIDTGDIICHGFPNIEKGDNMHRIGCKVVKETAMLFVKIFNMIEIGNKPCGIKQWYKGRLYQRKDFSAQAVIKARENISGGLVDQFLKKKNKSIPNFQSIQLI